MTIYNDYRKITIKQILCVVFAICVFWSFLSERTLLGQISLLLFIACSIFSTLVYNSRITIPLYFILDGLFVLYCFYQNWKHISYDNTFSLSRIKTYCICLIFYVSTFLFYKIIKDFDLLINIVFKSFYLAIVVNYICDIGYIFSGRFNNNDGINIFGIKIGGVIAISLGWIAGVCLFLNIYLYRVLQKNDVKYWFNFTFLTLTVFLSGTRKALLLVALAFVIQLSFQNDKKNIIKTIKNILLVSVMLLFALVMIYTIPFLYNSIGNRIESMLISFTQDEIIDNSMAHRDLLLQRAKELFSMKPITGWGLGGYEVASKADYYSHNNFYEILVSGGIIGFILYYSKYLYLVVKLISVRISVTNTLTKKTSTMFLILIIALTFLEIWQVTYFTRKFMLLHVLVLCFLEHKKQGVINENIVHCPKNAYKPISHNSRVVGE